MKHIEGCGQVSPDNYKNAIDICYLNVEMGQRSQLGGAYIQPQDEECLAVDEGKSAKGILQQSHRTQVAYVFANINDLYRGPIGDWLCALTYSQWTLAEMRSGLAVKMIRRYHA